MDPKCPHCGWRLTRNHYSKCRRLKRKQRLGIQVLINIANEIGMPFHFIDERVNVHSLSASDMQWTGTSLPVSVGGTAYTAFMFAHEMAHWIHASEDNRSLHNFGMTNTPFDKVEEVTVRLLEKTILQYAGL